MNMLQGFKDAMNLELYGMTRAQAHEKHICIKCRKHPVFITEAGSREYNISALCEPCFDWITRDPDEI